MRLGELANDILKRVNLKLGYTLLSRNTDKQFGNIYERCRKYTMTSEERMYALYNAVKYITDAKIKGDIVECGVWKGGSAMICAISLIGSKDKTRKIYLYDTFTGMSKPTKDDETEFNKEQTDKKWAKMQKNRYNKWCYSPIDEVKKNMMSTGYPEDKMVFIKGKVENTIPEKIPKCIALLRLDTDWYSSTYHELKYLFPLLSERGVLIIDDYGHWAGAKKAVDKYFKEKKINILLNPIDYSGRIGIKTKENKGARKHV